jgi:DNA modification methylase
MVLQSVQEHIEEILHPQFNTIYQGDTTAILPTFQDESVDLIITSPPYADQRKHTYGGISLI